MFVILIFIMNEGKTCTLKKILTVSIKVFFVSFFIFIPVVSFAAVTYDFNSDAVGVTPAGATVTAGSFNVIDDTILGKSLKAVTQDGVIAGIIFNNFATSSDYSVTWKQSYDNNLGRNGFTLRAQSSDTNVVNSVGAKQGYLFQVYDSSSLYIWKVGTNSYTSLWSGSLPKSKPRWFKAVAHGNSLGFYYSDNGSTYTHLATTTDSTYSSGVVQYTAGYGLAVNNDIVDDIVIEPVGIYIDGSNSFGGLSGTSIPITNLQIKGATSTVPVKLFVTSGTLSMATTTGITFNGASSGSTLYFSGSLTDINNALASLTYYRNGVGADTLEVSLVNSGEVFFSGSGHLYEYVSSTLTWGGAKTAAEGRSKYGATGYLTTITSQEENDFVAARLANAGWMGASDSASEGAWKWVTGPENGLQFWSGAAAGSTVSGRYANWNTGEPNDSGANEDCGQFLAGGSGKWNDLPCSGTTLPGYVVEYGTDSNPPTVVAKNISITTTTPLSVNTLGPLNNATSVSTSNNFSLVFNRAVTSIGGNITIKKNSNNSTVEIISATSSQVTGSGTNTIVIDPNTTLDDTTEYSILIDLNSFKDVNDIYYSGITSTSTWRFTTGDFTPPIITSISTSTATTTATISWITNENASTKVIYSANKLYASSTLEVDTSSRVTSHSINLVNLLPCTLYYIKSISSDSSLNYSTSTENYFITKGCIGGTSPSTSTSTSISSSSSATSTINDSGRILSVITPQNFTSTSTSVVIQIKGLESSSVISSIGTPNNLYIASKVAFDVKALINNETLLDSFESPVTVSYSYTDDDIQGIQEKTLSMYHYHDNTWEILENCFVDTDQNIITCTAPNFSVFAIFGQQIPLVISGGGIPYGCTDPKSLNYNPYVVNKPSLCEYSSSTQPLLDTSSESNKSNDNVATSSDVEVKSITSNSVCAPYIKTYIRYGADNNVEDVKKLQTFLNEKEGESLVIDGNYSKEDVEAVKRFQNKYKNEVLDVWGLSKATGYVYRTTLIKINSFYCNKTISCPYFNEYNSLKENNSSNEIKSTKILLNELGFYTGEMSDLYNNDLKTSIKKFQETFSETILKPWGISNGTGNKYKTTNKFLNLIVGCKTSSVNLEGIGDFNY